MSGVSDYKFDKDNIFKNMTDQEIQLGTWESAALDDPEVCDEYKEHIKDWFEHYKTHKTITIKEYEDLLDSRRLLLALENAGVDNWEGYSYAMEEYYENDEDY